MPLLSSRLLCCYVDRLQALDERRMAVVHCTVERVAGWRAPVFGVQIQQATLQVFGLPKTHCKFISLVLESPGQRIGEEAKHLPSGITERKACTLHSTGRRMATVEVQEGGKGDQEGRHLIHRSEQVVEQHKANERRPFIHEAEGGHQLCAVLDKGEKAELAQGNGLHDDEVLPVVSQLPVSQLMGDHRSDLALLALLEQRVKEHDSLVPKDPEHVCVAA